MWRVLVLALLLAGCPKDDSEDDYQMPPLPQYDPAAPAPLNIANLQRSLPKYQQVGPMVPAGPQGADGGPPAPPAPLAPEAKPR